MNDQHTAKKGLQRALQQAEKLGWPRELTQVIETACSVVEADAEDWEVDGFAADDDNPF